jgi:NADH:ubiquinone oxidoreductase subunit K
MTHLLRLAEPGVYHWIGLASLLFSIGIYGLLTRRNALGVLMAMELMLNAGAMSFVIFGRFVAPGQVDGQIMALFIISVAAAEAVVAIAIFIGVFRQRQTMDLTRMNLMKQ